MSVATELFRWVISLRDRDVLIKNRPCCPGKNTRSAIRWSLSDRLCRHGKSLARWTAGKSGMSMGIDLDTPKIRLLIQKKLDDGWPESVEEQGLLLLWRHHIRNNILKMCYMQSRRGVLRQNSRSARQ